MLLTLPFPPSLNHYWRHVVLPMRGGKSRAQVVISKDGREYREAVLTSCAACSLTRWPGHERLKVTLTLHAPDARKRDLDNHAKAALDALTHAGIWADDSQIDELRIVRGAKFGGAGLLRVLVERIPMALEGAA